jgi:hypothetical protein
MISYAVVVDDDDDDVVVAAVGFGCLLDRNRNMLKEVE